MYFLTQDLVMGLLIGYGIGAGAMYWASFMLDKD